MNQLKEKVIVTTEGEGGKLTLSFSIERGKGFKLAKELIEEYCLEGIHLNKTIKPTNSVIFLINDYIYVKVYNNYYEKGRVEIVVQNNEDAQSISEIMRVTIEVAKKYYAEDKNNVLNLHSFSTLFADEETYVNLTSAEKIAKDTYKYSVKEGRVFNIAIENSYNLGLSNSKIKNGYTKAFKDKVEIKLYLKKGFISFIPNLISMLFNRKDNIRNDAVNSIFYLKKENED